MARKTPGTTRSQPGMSLRDWFAGQAYAGGTLGRRSASDGSTRGRPHTRRVGGMVVHAIADAMLIARNEGESE